MQREFAAEENTDKLCASATHVKAPTIRDPSRSETLIELPPLPSLLPHLHPLPPPSLLFSPPSPAGC